MKASQPKRNQWLYLGFILMLVALLAFSILPLLGSIWQARASLTTNSGISPVISDKLENIALGYQLVLQREPENQNALRGLLEIRLKQGNLPEAIKPLESLAQLNPQETDYTILLAQAKQQLKDYTGAVATYQTILARDPKNMKALKGIVDVFILENRPQEAISFVENTLAKTLASPSSEQGSKSYMISLQLLLGEIFSEQQRYSEAIAVYDRAMMVDKDDFRPLLAKALALKAQGKTSEANPLFQQAVFLAPVEYKEQIKGMEIGK